MNSFNIPTDVVERETDFSDMYKNYKAGFYLPMVAVTTVQYDDKEDKNRKHSTTKHTNGPARHCLALFGL